MISEIMDNERIILEFDPYAYVRVLTMKSLLLKKEDYDRLLKMNLSEITKHLQERSYKKQIDSLAMKMPAAQLLERAISDNMIESFEKLKRITNKNVGILVNAYLMRYDIANIKTIIRGKISNIKNEEIKRLLLNYGICPLKVYDTLLNQQKIDDILLYMPLFSLDKRKQLVKLYHDEKSLFHVENMLDKQYAQYLLAIAERIPEEGELFKKLIVLEIDINNIKILLRSKKESLPFQQVKSYIVPEGLLFSRIRPGRLYNKEYAEILHNLERTQFGRIIKEYKKLQEQKKNSIELELLLNKFLLDSASLLSHQYPLSIYIILGYMISKDNEQRNLKLIVKGKQLEVDENFIQEQLVI